MSLNFTTLLRMVKSPPAPPPSLVQVEHMFIFATVRAPIFSVNFCMKTRKLASHGLFYDQYHWVLV